jgi:hypothetical protein
MAITLICPNLKCRTILQVPATIRGKKVRCGRCGKTFVVPVAPAGKKGAVATKEAINAEKK